MRAALAGALTCAALLAGCGDGSPGGTAPGSPSASVAAGSSAQPGLQVRPVLGSAEGASCDDSDDPPLPGNEPADEDVVLCDLDGAAQRLGPAAFVGGVERVRVSRLPGMPGYQALGIRLEQESARQLLELVSNAGSSDSRVAVVLDGLVLNTVSVASTVGGRLVLVGLEVPREQAQRYAALLAP